MFNDLSIAKIVKITHILVGHSLVFEHNLLHFKCFIYKIFFEEFPTNTLNLPSSTTQNLDFTFKNAKADLSIFEKTNIDTKQSHKNTIVILNMLK